ncbi:YceD family protein [Croceibacter atlanticus]|jgi:uncharacterized metal-binding protein YceD (DUF177 family)|uniref:DUF177 domain-containing protein n=1 Tax=Croceibacter atlanticus (strain ATCC BAA-628 / JCM 21780 / CIP 108009 / IAM 15332 / KCTC 12090 / HTCC2559) TaxID=216432 RepID=A3U5N9_CROAH|nr:DUF177 domain-containing protein [Croceibacter atlanticus]MAM23023.1 hypothetical protein [Croceibacter sp.]HAT70097.1 DUF177 domain-containing protein [Flavobacteriaceae bacterium]EAP87556.1 hypothetical protein CA2559_02335 [Croceibacter atlanticus HTCC2559]MBW4970210.1 DUF177 domain-containing protein [Croceibacter atlanticus]WSP35232.1 DUF177 domain-containing protein [Croceibacter atlanticus]|tara:strand:- start:100899 stop:101426 length:528 start_codon:yes stop_codon:yes gene_type:complete
MKQLKEFTIPFVGLKVGKHQFNYTIGQSFFDVFEYDEFNDANVNVTLDFEKKPTMFELLFHISGTVNVNGDLTNEPYDQPIENELKLVVKFGPEFNDENEELLILPHGEYEINVQQYIYEAIVLAVPLKRIHPGIEDGTLKTDVLKKLEELSPKQKENEEVDPRWNKLKELLKDK